MNIEQLVLLEILKSQLKIEYAVEEDLEESKLRYDTNNVNDLLDVTKARIRAIESQISKIERGF